MSRGYGPRFYYLRSAIGCENKSEGTFSSSDFFASQIVQKDCQASSMYSLRSSAGGNLSIKLKVQIKSAMCQTKIIRFIKLIQSSSKRKIAQYHRPNFYYRRCINKLKCFPCKLLYESQFSRNLYQGSYLQHQVSDVIL